MRQLPDHGRDPLQLTVTLLEHGVDASLQLGRGIVQHGGEQRLLGGEVLVEHRLGAARAASYLGRASTVESVSRKHRAGGVQDHLATHVEGEALAWFDDHHRRLVNTH